ncbi:MAG: ParB/RepB/Spo0J family partition protein, partial [Clostridia bacterium]
MQIAKYDDLFKNDAERLADTQERIQSLPLDKLVPFPNHPFKVLDDEKMQETVDSIRDYGVLVPILVRPKDDGNFEIVAGHRRHHASMLAGKTEIPAVVRDMDDDAAILVMVDSNLQRETILPSEKAFAYKMKLDAMKRQGKRTDLTSAQLVPKLQARDVVARDAGINRMEVTRFIRLTALEPPLLDMVDNGNMAFTTAVEVSYLTPAEQTMLTEV